MLSKSPKPFIDKRPWGEELWITDEKPSMVKILTIFSGQYLSLQYHKNREEYWKVISGNGFAQIGDSKTPLEKGSECFVTKNTHHRLIGGTEDLVILELAFGDFDENDIIRLEDKYGRI